MPRPDALFGECLEALVRYMVWIRSQQGVDYFLQAEKGAQGGFLRKGTTLTEAATMQAMMILRALDTGRPLWIPPTETPVLDRISETLPREDFALVEGSTPSDYGFAYFSKALRIPLPPGWREPYIDLRAFTWTSHWRIELTVEQSLNVAMGYKGVPHDPAYMGGFGEYAFTSDLTVPDHLATAPRKRASSIIMSSSIVLSFQGVPEPVTVTATPPPPHP